MSNRHLLRSIAMQSLFQWDFMGCPSAILPALIDQNIAEFAPGMKDEGFVLELVDGVLKHQKEIDDLIQKFAPQWPLDQITIIDRNILRLGTYELQFSQTIPAKVAINDKEMVAHGALKQIDRNPAPQHEQEIA
ncbi:MAG: transcription antitermination protein NusB [Candidatus Magasanikbacteria bacterium]|nr:transcription antitermination protein NusB [Candidatus Magasanikbacteria bacterium]